MDNSTSPSNFTDYINFASIRSMTTYEISIFLLLSILTLITIFANLFVLFLFMRGKRTLRSPTHYLLANLALADLSVGAFVMPGLSMVTISTGTKWYFGPFLCSKFEFVHFTLCATSMLSGIAVGVERLIGVKWPLKHKSIATRGRVKLLMVAVWLGALLMTWTPLIIWQDGQEEIPYLCFPNLGVWFVRFIGFVVYMVPMGVTVGLYTVIYFTARKKMDLRHLPKSEATKTLIAKAREVGLAKRITLVVSIILLMFCPLFVMFLLKGWDSPLFDAKIFLALGWLRYINSTVNPFVYALAVPGYKAEFYRMLYNGGGHDEDDVETTGFSSSTTGNNYSESDSDVEPSSIGYDSLMESRSSSSSYPVAETRKQRVSFKPEPMISLTNLDKYRHFCPGCGQKVGSCSDNARNDGFCDSCISHIRLNHDPLSLLKEAVDNNSLKPKEKVDLVRLRGSKILLDMKDVKDPKLLRQTLLEPLIETRDDIMWKKRNPEDSQLFEEVESIVTSIEKYLSELKDE